MKLLILSILLATFSAFAETDEVNESLCEPILKVPPPLATTFEQCYGFAKSVLKKDPKNPGSAERYLEIAYKDKKANKECVRVIRDVTKEVRKAGLRDETIFPKPKNEKSESHATLDEAFYFHGECVNLAKAAKAKTKAVPKPSEDAASAPTK